jgi:nucleotide-binding universal stress UspA family protein
MVIGTKRRRILCISGCDENSLIALKRTRDWQRAFHCPVRALFVVTPDLPASRALDAAWFRWWAAREAALDIALDDIIVCGEETFPKALAQAAGMLTSLIVCPAASDEPVEVNCAPPGRLWPKIARMGVPLFVARSAVSPPRVLVVSDGTPRTLPVLEAAFDLGQYMSAALSYLDTLRIRISSDERVLPAARALALQPGMASGFAHDVEHPYRRAARSIASVMAQAGMRESADILVVGIAPSDAESVEQIARASPCSVLAVPCPA